jgi:hypothetical protein
VLPPGLLPPPPVAERKSSVELPLPEVVVTLPPPLAVVIVPLVPNLITGPNVCPASVDTLSTDSFVCGCV